MVKVTIENDKNKDEITGEFFMGLMLTKEEKTEDSTTYKACAIRTGNTCVQDLPNNVTKWIVSTFGAVYKTKLGSTMAKYFQQKELRKGAINNVNAKKSKTS